jgi:hypothetical protein
LITKILFITYIKVPIKSCDGSVGTALGYGWKIGVLGFNSRQWLRIFLFNTVSGTALLSTQPPIEWISGALFLG